MSPLVDRVLESCEKHRARKRRKEEKGQKTGIKRSLRKRFNGLVNAKKDAAQPSTAQDKRAALTTVLSPGCIRLVTASGASTTPC